MEQVNFFVEAGGEETGGKGGSGEVKSEEGGAGGAGVGFGDDLAVPVGMKTINEDAVVTEVLAKQRGGVGEEGGEVGVTGQAEELARGESEIGAGWRGEFDLDEPEAGASVASGEANRVVRGGRQGLKGGGGGGGEGFRREERNQLEEGLPEGVVGREREEAGEIGAGVEDAEIRERTCEQRAD